jgi:hypothetical protein
VRAGWGAPIGDPLTGQDGAVLGVAVGELEGRPVIVSTGEDRTVRMWSLRGGAPIGEPIWIGSVVATVAAEGSTAAVGAAAGLLLIEWHATPPR